MSTHGGLVGTSHIHIGINWMYLPNVVLTSDNIGLSATFNTSVTDEYIVEDLQQAVEVDASNHDAWTASDHADFDFIASFTYTKTVRFNNVSGIECLIDKLNDSDEGFRIQRNGDELKAFLDAGTSITTNANLVINKWYEIVFEYDSVNQSTKWVVNDVELIKTEVSIPSSITANSKDVIIAAEGDFSAGYAVDISGSAGEEIWLESADRLVTNDNSSFTGQIRFAIDTLKTCWLWFQGEINAAKYGWGIEINSSGDVMFHVAKAGRSTWNTITASAWLSGETTNYVVIKFVFDDSGNIMRLYGDKTTRDGLTLAQIATASSIADTSPAPNSVRTGFCCRWDGGFGDWENSRFDGKIDYHMWDLTAQLDTNPIAATDNEWHYTQDLTDGVGSKDLSDNGIAIEDFVSVVDPHVNHLDARIDKVALASGKGLIIPLTSSTTGIKGLWYFDGSLADSSGNGHTLVAEGASDYVWGYSRIETTAVGDFRVGWYEKVNDSGRSASQQSFIISRKGEEEDFWAGYITTATGYKPKLLMYYSASLSWNVIATSEQAYLSENHVVWAFDEAALEVVLYINDAEEGRATNVAQTGLVLTGTIQARKTVLAQPIAIGGTDVGGAALRYKGDLANVFYVDSFVDSSVPPKITDCDVYVRMTQPDENNQIADISESTDLLDRTMMFDANNMDASNFNTLSSNGESNMTVDKLGDKGLDGPFAFKLHPDDPVYIEIDLGQKVTIDYLVIERRQGLDSSKHTIKVRYGGDAGPELYALDLGTVDTLTINDGGPIISHLVRNNIRYVNIELSTSVADTEYNYIYYIHVGIRKDFGTSLKPVYAIADTRDVSMEENWVGVPYSYVRSDKHMRFRGNLTAAYEASDIQDILLTLSEFATHSWPFIYCHDNEGSDFTANSVGDRELLYTRLVYWKDGPLFLKTVLAGKLLSSDKEEHWEVPFNLDEDRVFRDPYELEP